MNSSRKNILRLKGRQLLLIFLSVFILAQVSWWIVFHFRIGDEILEEQKSLWKRQIATAESWVKISETPGPHLLHMLETTFPDLIYDPVLKQFFVKKDALERVDEKTTSISRMFVFEGSFFSLIIGIGIFYLYWILRREIKLERQQANFLSAISHELKTPITALKLFENTLFIDSLTEDEKEEIKISFSRSLNDLQETIERLLNAKDISFKRNRRDLTPLPIIQTTNTILDEIRLKQNSDIKIQSNFPEDDILCRIEPEKWRIIVLNLVENSIKYSKETPNIKIEIKPSSRKFSFKITDNGIGFERKEARNIFKLFYRLEDEDRRQFSGTGLGLYLIHETVKSMRGKVTAYSDGPGQGATFKVTIPV